MHRRLGAWVGRPGRQFWAVMYDGNFGAYKDGFALNGESFTGWHKWVGARCCESSRLRTPFVIVGLSRLRYEETFFQFFVCFVNSKCTTNRRAFFDPVPIRALQWILIYTLSLQVHVKLTFLISIFYHTQVSCELQYCISIA